MQVLSPSSYSIHVHAVLSTVVPLVFHYRTTLLFYRACSRKGATRSDNHRSLPALFFSHLWHNVEGLSQLRSWQISLGTSSRLVWPADEGAGGSSGCWHSSQGRKKGVKSISLTQSRVNERVNKGNPTVLRAFTYHNSLPDSWSFQQGRCYHPLWCAFWWEWHLGRSPPLQAQ